MSCRVANSVDQLPCVRVLALSAACPRCRYLWPDGVCQAAAESDIAATSARIGRRTRVAGAWVVVSRVSRETRLTELTQNCLGSQPLPSPTVTA